jgi:spore coat protein U-like protein
MTKRLVLLLAAAAGAIAGSTEQVPAATATYTLNVSGTVSASCTLTAVAVAFGALSTSANTNATGSVTINCTPGNSLTIALSGGANASSLQRRISNGTNFANYNLYQPTAAGNAQAAGPVPWGDGSVTATGATFNTTGTGAAQVFNVYGQVPSGQTLSAGLYSDAVTVTLTY